MPGGEFFHTHPGPMTTRTLNELMQELEHKWTTQAPLTLVEQELLHRWRMGRLIEERPWDGRS